MKKQLEHFSYNVRWLRNLNELTQTELSVKLNCTRSIIGAYEEGRAEAKFEMLIKMADLFNVSIDDLLRKKITSVHPK